MPLAAEPAGHARWTDRGERPVRILLANGNYRDGTCGGTQVFTERLARWLRDAGYRVGVLTTGDASAYRVEDGIHVFRVLPPHVRIVRDRQPVRFVNQCLAIQNPLVASAARRVLRRFDPDVCHVNMFRRLTPSILAALTGRSGRPVVQTVHELYSLWDFNAFQYEDSPDKIHTARPRIVDVLKARHRVLSARVAHVCAPSTFVLNAYDRDGYFRSVPRSVIPLAVDHEWGDPEDAARARAARADRAQRRFLYIGRLDYVKGVTELLAAFAQLDDPGARLHIAGSGVLESAVRHAAACDARICFHGFVEGARRRALFLDADVVVCPSVWGETFGLSVLEGSAAGMPSIVTRVGGLPDFVQHGRTGLVIEPGSVVELRRAMENLSNAERRHAMGIQSATRARAHAPDAFLRAQLEIYRSVLER